MFTTDTPDAQLLSMLRSAAMPPKLAPISYAGGDSYHRTGDESSHHAGQGSFHSCHDYGYVRLEQIFAVMQ